MVVHDDARTVLGMLDLATSATAPLLGAGKLDSYDFSPGGGYLIGATTGVARVGSVALDNLHPTDCRLDDMPVHVLASQRQDLRRSRQRARPRHGDPVAGRSPR
jgi:hypothetical protein